MIAGGTNVNDMVRHKDRRSVLLDNQWRFLGVLPINLVRQRLTRFINAMLAEKFVTSLVPSTRPEFSLP